jgi:hypothetical protein
MRFFSQLDPLKQSVDQFPKEREIFMIEMRKRRTQIITILPFEKMKIEIFRTIMTMKRMNFQIKKKRKVNSIN